ncbi:MAG: thiamine phosphate synthase [Gallionella sp.]|nr:thiamine phosphate synthase [Gallionella sp.]
MKKKSRIEDRGLRIDIKDLYAITPDQADTALLVWQVRQVLSGGARVLQYRNKLSSPVVRFEQASALRQLTQEFGVPLIINDDAQLAQQVDADGVHLGGEDGSIAAARQVLGFDKIIGVSCYNRLSLAQQAEGLGADYVAFGAFFASMVKPRARVVELPLLQEARRVIKLPVVAIGGITLENGASVLEAGADALAVISALFSAPDIMLAARQFANLNTQSSV